MAILVKITQSDIKRGKQQSPSACPIARSLKRKYPKQKISVGPWIAYVGKKGYRLSEEGTSFISKFDSGLAVSPFTLQITRIQPSL